MANDYGIPWFSSDFNNWFMNLKIYVRGSAFFLYFNKKKHAVVAMYGNTDMRN